jgi:hypothetical protein
MRRSILFVLLAGCAQPDSFADEVVQGELRDEPFGDPRLAINGVRGEGETRGSLDVYSLDRAHPTLTLGWSARRIFDGPGDDLVVFENAFRVANTEAFFMDPVIVEVSSDGENFVALPHDYLASDEARYSTNPAMFEGFAGVRPVHLHHEMNPLDAFDESAGGDRFDLQQLANVEGGAEILAEGIAYVRLVMAAMRTNPDTGREFVSDGFSNGPDIDGVAARYFAPQ